MSGLFILCEHSACVYPPADCAECSSAELCYDKSLITQTTDRQPIPPMYDFKTYQTDNFYDEWFQQNGIPRESVRLILEKIQNLSPAEIKQKQKAAELAFLNMGITFTVGGSENGVDKIFPFDILPRIIEASEWETVEKGLKQRIEALNLFLNDIYGKQQIIKDRIIPEEVVFSGKAFMKECLGFTPPKGIWCHITGTDLVRDINGKFHVLEDNLRCPSGVSYVIENRLVLKRIFPTVFSGLGVRHVDDYSAKLLETLEHLCPHSGNAKTVVLTPGVYNSAYFEHSFLAKQMGAELVEGSDLIVKDDKVYMRTTDGFEKVDVIYRRIDDTFLDPTFFNPDSMLGVPGIMNAYMKGNVALANAPGTGIADDKVVYKYVPDMIRYYLKQDAILPNVPTYLCINEDERDYVLKNLEKLVVKAANEAGGYGMLIGLDSSPSQRQDFAEKIKANPRNYLAQPVVSLSRVPTLVENNFEGRHVDLRPYILYGKSIYILPGGLTRVALKKGSLVVNSSQGGGSKDTWVLNGDKSSC